MKKKKYLFGLISFFIMIIVGICLFYINGVSSVSNEDKDVIVTIEKGQGASSILDRLDEAGLVNNKLCGKIFLKLNHFQSLQANTYIFNENMNLNDMFSIMENPKNKYILRTKITIKEGTTILDISKEIANKLDLKEEEVLNQLSNKEFLNQLIKDYWFIDSDILNSNIKYPLEGYLYPETYLFNLEEVSVENIVRQALDMMDEKITPYKESINKMNWSIHQFLTFSSIVERESLFDKDRPIIAEVFLNRLATNMRLQSDITVNYAWQRDGVDVTYKHLQIDSPYNTYKYNGLPIGPISTVSLKTMDACIHHDNNDYFYFFAKEDGSVIYSKTLEEHNKAVKEYKWY